MSINYSLFEYLFYEIVNLTERSVAKNPYQEIDEYPIESLELTRTNDNKIKKTKLVSIQNEEESQFELFPIPNKQQLVCKKLESTGFRLGTRLIEQYCLKKRSMFTEERIVRLVCKDFWSHLFKGTTQLNYDQNDKVWLLIVNNFVVLSRISFSKNGKKEKKEISKESNVIQQSQSLPSTNKNLKKNVNLTQSNSLIENNNNYGNNENEKSKKKKKKSKKNKQKSPSSNLKKLNQQKQNEEQFQKNRINTQSQIETINKYLQFVCGVVRGAFWNLNVNSIISTNYSNLNKIKFIIKLEN
ncbi:trafficking protein particle complex subunit 6b [Anaeramoeba flamelloides]|uniref:Trafficking protein particle complex subunit 6b n=1 Tax=Anaeramoeba flamelloides TaxID=1746091 RepID=A0ABQ8Z789_9EUKA|nr:trafficking protein particle complex subunit 6b [Anaeramoeba flamelloides]